MAEQYRIDQPGSRDSGLDVVIRQEITIINELGLHARPAAEFVLAAKAFRSLSRVLVERNTRLLNCARPGAPFGRWPSTLVPDVLRCNSVNGLLGDVSRVIADAFEIARD